VWLQDEKEISAQHHEYRDDQCNTHSMAKLGHSKPVTRLTTAMTQITDVTATTASMLFSFHMRVA